METLSIGRISVDEYHNPPLLDEPLRRYAGSGFIVAQWFGYYGAKSSLATTLTEDFPSLSQLSYQHSKSTDEPTPVCEIHLNDGNDDENTGMKSNYELRPLDTIDKTFDIIFLCSVESEFLPAFESATAPIKAYDPGLALDAYSPSKLERGFTEATHVFLSDEEQEYVETELSMGLDEIQTAYGIETLFCTSKERVRVFEANSEWDFPVETLDWTVDSLGAGDAFAASYLVALSRGVSQDNCLEFATDVARHTTLQVGSLPYVFTRDTPW